MKRILVLAVFLPMILLNLEAKKVKGSVRCGKEKLESVIVSDGVNFARTGSNGKFALDIADDADFVFVVTPKGYTVDYSAGHPVFYLPADGRKSYDFELVKTCDSDDYTIVAIGDPQMKDSKHVKKFRETAMPDLRAFMENYKGTNVVGLALGDISWDVPEVYEVFNEEMATLGFPVYAVIGNHDHLKDLVGDRNTAVGFRNTFGPENYAFSVGNDYVIVLDNIIYEGNKKFREGYTEEQLAWLGKLLEYLPESAHFYVVTHSPNFEWFNNESYILNAEKLMGLFGDRQVTMISGHTHINNNFQLTPNVYEANVAAICGTWWATPHCNDGTPSGYKIFEKRDGELSWFYKSIGYEKDYQVEIYTKGQSEKYPDSIVANIWDYDPAWSVQWFEDGVSKGEMIQCIDISPVHKEQIMKAYKGEFDKIPAYRRPRPNTHYFYATPSQGAKHILIVIKGRFGEEWTYELTL